MFAILIVDDDRLKLARIAAAIDRIVSGVGARVDTAATSTEAAERLRQQTYDLLILDLMIPVRGSEEPNPYGGSAVLRTIQAESANRPKQVVLLTAYPNLEESYRSLAEQESWVILHYDSTVDDWIRRLGTELVEISNTAHQNQSEYKWDLAIVSALHSVELEAVLAWPFDWKEHQIGGDDAIYFSTEGQVDGEKVRLIAASAVEVGMPASTALCMKVIDNFRPRYLAMVGIAAGVDGSFGDILVADQCWDYGSGKVRSDPSGSNFSPAPRSIQLHPKILYMVNVMQMEPELLDRIRSSWNGEEGPSKLRLRVGGIASGASVIESREVINGVAKHNRKLLGIEMESYGVFLAAKVAREPRPIPIVIKSICDFGDPNKNDDYQRYAGHTSARFLYELATRFLLAAKKRQGVTGT